MYSQASPSLPVAGENKGLSQAARNRENPHIMAKLMLLLSIHSGLLYLFERLDFVFARVTEKQPAACLEPPRFRHYM